NASGTIFAADWNGVVYRYSAAGALQASLDTNLLPKQAVGINNLTDVDVSRTGKVLVGTRSGDVIVTDESFASPSVLALSTSATFVSSAAYPRGDSSTVASVRGSVFDDADADGIRDAGEAGLQGATVYLDLNGNGMRDVGGAVEPDDFAAGVNLDNAVPG